MLETATKIVPKRTGCCYGDLLPSAVSRKPDPSSYTEIQVMSLNVGFLQFREESNAMDL